MSVKRYSILDHQYDMAEMEEDPSGDYVKHSDFVALAAENEAMRGALAHLDYTATIMAHDAGYPYDKQKFHRLATLAHQALSRKAAP